MGREVRQVPPNWEHPRYTDRDAPRSQLIGKYRPCFDQDFEAAAAEWVEGFDQWRAGKHPCQDDYPYWEWKSPPERDSCRPKFSQEPTWWQVYETVSEGTPVTPPFPTKEELVDWLVNKGENHGTEYEERFSRKAAEGFVEAGYALSMVVSGGRAMRGIEAYDE